MREEAYALVQKHALTAWDEESDFRLSVENDPTVRRFLSARQLQQTFSLDPHLASVDAIFHRVFGKPVQA